MCVNLDDFQAQKRAGVQRAEAKTESYALENKCVDEGKVPSVSEIHTFSGETSSNFMTLHRRTTGIPTQARRAE